MGMQDLSSHKELESIQQVEMQQEDAEKDEVECQPDSVR